MDLAHLYIIDASVFLNAFNPHEDGHEDSRELLAGFQTRGVPLVCPTLLLPEVAGAIRRGREDAALAREFAGALRSLPHLILVPLDETLAAQASQIAAEHALRGSDAVYAAVALRFGGALVTLDREQHARLKHVLPTHFPAELLRGTG